MRVVLFPSRTLVKWGLITHLRKKRALLMLLAFWGVAFLGTAAFWPEGHLYQMAYASKELLMLVSMFFMGGAFVFVPGLAAVTVTVEKERDTFDQLFLTLIRPSGVIMAKLANVLGIYYLLVIGAMPVLGAIFFLVGVDWQQVVLMFGLVTATAFSCGMAGILCSTFFRKTIVSMIASYILALCLVGAQYLLLVLLEFTDLCGEIIGGIEDITQICSPFAVMVDTNYVGSFGSQKSYLFGAILYQIVFALFFFVLTRRILTRPPKTLKVESAVIERRRRQFPFYLIDPLRHKPSIENHHNPMLIKELRWGILSWTGGLIRVFYGVFIIYMAMAIYVIVKSEWYSSGNTISFVVMQMIVTILVIPLLLANSMAKEYEMGNMDLLRSTLLTPHEIILGKVGAGALTLGPLLLASVCSGTLMAGSILLMMSLIELVYLFTGYVSLVTCVLLSLGIGMFASVFTRQTSTALIVSYSLSLLIYVGLPLVGSCFFSYICGDMHTSTFAAFLSPISAYVHAAHSTGVSPFNVYWLSNVVLFSLIGFGFLAVTVYHFAQSGMKDK